MTRITLAIACFGAATLLGAASRSKSDLDHVRKVIQAAEREASGVPTYLETLPHIGDHYVTEGDLPRSKADIVEHFEWFRREKNRIVQDGKELAINKTSSDQDDIWPRAQRALTYSIDRASFRSPAEAEEALTRFGEAAAEWVQVCGEGNPCGVTFTFKEDGAPSPTKVTFVLSGFDSEGAFAAAAFFPSWATERRYLYVDPAFFTGTRDYRRGVMRHEVGHVLGYRHEHLEGVPGCGLAEDGQWRRLVSYTPNSVMHYRCGGGGTANYDFAESDKTEHKKLYSR